MDNLTFSLFFPYSSNLEHKMLVLKSDCYAFSLFSSFKMKTHETFFRNTMIFSRFLTLSFFLGRNRYHSENVRKVPSREFRVSSENERLPCVFEKFAGWWRMWKSLSFSAKISGFVLTVEILLLFFSAFLFKFFLIQYDLCRFIALENLCS